MTRYFVEAVPADSLNHPLVERCDGFKCRRYTGHADLCRPMIDQAFMYTIPQAPDSHDIDAWDVDEAVRIAACWVVAEHGDNGLARVRESYPSNRYVAYLRGAELVAS